ncbi:SIMPL domain-containing protein [Acidovorax sp. SUPP2522]|uniref:SIMPL domain-containing protein n=1 Tax=unclassified Acidovorax TaxID=2684926 RepID=UPI0023493181|nr:MULTISPECIES: SIMPL domain-containing protein [unclassified Acidovorax]WCM95925.1 SIMPL domain-containing protein [Acidovorax sp. GBBC 1281]GKT14473.1 SIMPL domain-containing protein [Acidovorax sp. SUPP2522]
MKIATKIIAAGALLVCAGASVSQNAVMPPPQNVLQLSATGTVDVQQDLLVLTLATSKEGADAATVQTQLKQALDSALAEAKRSAQPDQMDVRTGAFGMYPRYGKEGKINGWQGRAELILQGRDFSRITTTAGKIQSMPISQIAFDLSREAREKVEGEAQTKAIEQFKARANELARGFGFSGYTLREVAVNNNEMIPGPRPRMMAMEAKMSSMSADAPVPVEAGKAQVVVNVSGAVQLR